MQSGSLSALQNLLRPIGLCLLVVCTNVGHAIHSSSLADALPHAASGVWGEPTALWAGGDTTYQRSSSCTALGCVVGAVVSFWPKWEEGRNVDSRVAPGLLFQSPQLGQGSGAAPEPRPLFSRGLQCSLAHGRQCILRCCIPRPPLPCASLRPQGFRETSSVPDLLKPDLPSVCMGWDGVGCTRTGTLEVFLFAFYLGTSARWPQMPAILEFAGRLFRSSSSCNGPSGSCLSILWRRLRSNHQEILPDVP